MIIFINSNSCCCNHFHNNKCIFQNDFEKKYIHNKIHIFKSKKCLCKYEQTHYHDKNCDYFQLFNDKDIKKNIKDLKEEKDMDIVCCCERDIQHNEILKILYKPNDKSNGNYSIFEFNGKGETIINSKMRLFYDKNKFDFIVGRKSIIAKIFNNIVRNEHFVILFGEKYLAKMFFTESLCVYLFERKIINNYKIFRINNESDFYYIKDIIFHQEINHSHYYDKEKDAIIIKFNIEKDNVSFKLFAEIYKLFYPNYIKKLFFIFIFNLKEEKNDENIIEQEKQEKFKEYMKNYIPKDIKIIPKENLFYIGLNEHSSLYLLNHFLKEKDMGLSVKEKINLIKEKTEYKPIKIKILSELILQGETIENIKNMKELKITSVKLPSNESTYKLYYLLLNMPSGLPDCFLKLIFNDYPFIKNYNIAN